MTKTIDSLIPDILVLFSDGHSVTDGVHEFSKKIGEVFIDRLSQKEHQSRNIRLSQIGKPLRQIYYELTGAPSEKLSAQTKLKFAYGAILEEMMIFLAVEAGHDVQMLQQEVEIDGVLGHIDCLIDGVLVDVKSCSSYSFGKFANGTLLVDDPFGYCYQLSSYWACFPDVVRAGFLAVDKVNGRLCFMELSKDERKSETDVRGRIASIREAFDGGTVPERCYDPQPLSKSDKSGNLVLGVGCSYCPFKVHCWSDANNGEGLKSYYYSTGIKHFVKINKEPRVSPVTDEASDEFPTKGV